MELIGAYEARPEVRGRPLGTISTLVSLFLLLLVFFVLLFSIAEVHRQRTDEVLASVDVAFAGLPSRLGLIPPPSDIPSPESATAAFVHAVSEIILGFADVGPAGQAGNPTDLLRIDLPIDALFGARSTKLTPRAAGMIPRLAVLLQRRPNSKQHFRMSVRLGVMGPSAPEPGPGPSPPDGHAAENLALERASVLAAALFDAGCPDEALEVGLATDSSSTAIMAFSRLGQSPEAE